MAPAISLSLTGLPFTTAYCSVPCARWKVGNPAKPSITTSSPPPEIGTAFSINSEPIMRATRAARVSPEGASSQRRSSVTKENPISGWARAKRRNTSKASAFSLRSVFKNFNRAGVAKNKSRTSTSVPLLKAAGEGPVNAPASTKTAKASALPRSSDVIDNRATLPIDGKASPRKPSVAIFTKSSSGIFDVA